jgi:hypothetical protein
MPIPTAYNASVPLHGIKGKLTTVRQYIQWYKMERWLICGTEIHSGEKLSVLYTGVLQHKNYFAALVFDNNYTEKCLGRAHLWQLWGNSDKRSNDHFMAITEGLKLFSNAFRKKGYHYIPGWILGEISLPADFSGLINNRSIKSDVNRIKDNNLVCEVTRDLSWFDQFYYEMYRPLVQVRHGKAAITNTYGQLHSIFKRSSLLLIKKNGMVIAGSMVSMNRNSGRLWVFGVRGGNKEYIKEGIMIALYYYSIRFLHTQGCRKINLGGTRAFLNDGILFYKKKWGFKVKGESSVGFFLKTLNSSPGVKSFLQHNPYINIDKEGNSAVFFIESEEAAQGLLDNIKNRRFPEGLDWIVISTLSEDAGIRQIFKIPVEITKQL